jgi:TonB family protein
LKKMGVEYSVDDRRHYHQGKGAYRVILDSKTGAVSDIVVIKSTGVATLDRSVLIALRQWRWKPGRWKEITIPVNFHMTTTPEPLKPGEIPLPHP